MNRTETESEIRKLYLQWPDAGNQGNIGEEAFSFYGWLRDKNKDVLHDSPLLRQNDPPQVIQGWIKDSYEREKSKKNDTENRH